MLVVVFAVAVGHRVLVASLLVHEFRATSELILVELELLFGRRRADCDVGFGLLRLLAVAASCC